MAVRSEVNHTTPWLLRAVRFVDQNFDHARALETCGFDLKAPLKFAISNGLHRGKVLPRHEFRWRYICEIDQRPTRVSQRYGGRARQVQRINHVSTVVIVKANRVGFIVAQLVLSHGRRDRANQHA